MDSDPQTINCNRCRRSRKCDTVAALTALLDRDHFLMPLGTPRYHTFVTVLLYCLVVYLLCTTVFSVYSQFFTAQIGATYILLPRAHTSALTPHLSLPSHICLAAIAADLRPSSSTPSCPYTNPFSSLLVSVRCSRSIPDASLSEFWPTLVCSMPCLTW